MVWKAECTMCIYIPHIHNLRLKKGEPVLLCLSWLCELCAIINIELPSLIPWNAIWCAGVWLSGVQWGAVQFSTCSAVMCPLATFMTTITLKTQCASNWLAVVIKKIWNFKNNTLWWRWRWLHKHVEIRSSKNSSFQQWSEDNVVFGFVHTHVAKCVCWVTYLLYSP